MTPIGALKLRWLLMMETCAALACPAVRPWSAPADEDDEAARGSPGAARAKKTADKAADMEATSLWHGADGLQTANLWRDRAMTCQTLISYSACGFKRLGLAGAQPEITTAGL
jgi:hypothetical protein